jgi:hypothetical protein
VSFRTEPSLNAPDDTRSETVERPEPGLARGRWEAPAWFFYAVLALAIAGSAAWAIAARRRRIRLRSGMGR